jgi:uncharacterized ferritin-like protein (DUF455 family)
MGALGAGGIEDGFIGAYFLGDEQETWGTDVRILGMDLRHQALRALCVSDPSEKVEAVQALWSAHAGFPLDRHAALDEPAGLPGRPALPRRVSPKDVPQRGLGAPAGRAGLLHAIAHIEFNAINLALDAAWRFAGMPTAFYMDWLRVANEEALHFSLLTAHLATLGHQYGDFDAHDGLWTMALRTKDDIVARMALVPRTLEARGLDATPLIQNKLRQVGDLRAVEILDTILRDEVGHVAIGNHWFRWLCERGGLVAEAVYPQLVQRYEAPRLRPPFNVEARRRAGFTADELSWLAQQT